MMRLIQGVIVTFKIVKQIKRIILNTKIILLL